MIPLTGATAETLSLSEPSCIDLHLLLASSHHNDVVVIAKAGLALQQEEGMDGQLLAASSRGLPLTSQPLKQAWGQPTPHTMKG